MSALTAELKATYQHQWDVMVVHPDRVAEAANVARAIAAHRDRYKVPEAATGVPWWWIGIIHNRECSLRFDQHLHNGDPLSSRTTHFPPGRPPPPADPPFQWEASSIDALKYEGLESVQDWSIAGSLFRFEAYNGEGYHARHLPSPYVFAGSNQYVCGKYIQDGVFSYTTVDQQLGAALVLRALIDGKFVVGFK